jgi:hypothetical protein
MTCVGWPAQYPLDEHLKLRGLTACTCPHKWESLGKLHGTHWGDGWVRALTVKDCPEHGEEAGRVRTERIRALGLS